MVHLKRWITSLIALPGLVWLIGRGSPTAFLGLMLLVCVLALWEYDRIIPVPRIRGFGRSLSLLGLITGPLLIGAAHAGKPDLMLGLLSGHVVLAGLLSLSQFASDPNVTDRVVFGVAGGVYIPLALSYLVWLRSGVDGALWVFFLLFVVFAGDTGAYFVGSYFGRRKLCPSISPGKTLEGSAAGLAANVAAGLVFSQLLLPVVSPAKGLLFCLTVGAAGQVGDLFESEYKRRSRIKDSGSLLPGHGGILDRIDALLFAAPVAYFYKSYIF